MMDQLKPIWANETGKIRQGFWERRLDPDCYQHLFYKYEEKMSRDEADSMKSWPYGQLSGMTEPLSQPQILLWTPHYMK